MDVLRYWGLCEKPFETTLEGRFFYASPVHAEALARLELLAEDGDMGFGLLTGEIGSGKTFAAALFARGLDPGRFASIFLPSGNLGFACILDEVNCTLRAEAPTGRVGSPYELHVEFRRLLERRLAPRGQHLVLVIDEAQELSERDLADLRCLSNAAAGTRNAMSIVLVGQPELRDRVRSMPAVDTRVGLRYHLRRLAAADARAYVEHRLVAAGSDGRTIFDDDAVAVLAGRAGGVPRSINRLARLSLYAVASRGARCVDAGDVSSVADDIDVVAA